MVVAVVVVVAVYALSYHDDGAIGDARVVTSVVVATGGRAG